MKTIHQNSLEYGSLTTLNLALTRGNLDLALLHELARLDYVRNCRFRWFKINMSKSEWAEWAAKGKSTFAVDVVPRQHHLLPSLPLPSAFLPSFLSPQHSSPPSSPLTFPPLPSALIFFLLLSLQLFFSSFNSPALPSNTYVSFDHSIVYAAFWESLNAKKNRDKKKRLWHHDLCVVLHYSLFSLNIWKHVIRKVSLVIFCYAA